MNIFTQDDPVTVDWQVAGVGDFNGDGYSDILWRHDGGHVSIWYMEHAMHVGEACCGWRSSDWQIQGVADFNADGQADILWRDTATGKLVIYFSGLYEVDESSRRSYPTWHNWPGYHTGPEWQVEGLGDFNADGRADIVWRHDDGTVSIWLINSGWYIGESALLPMDPAWQLRGLLPQAPQRLELQ
jgi:hypothetical protein